VLLALAGVPKIPAEGQEEPAVKSRHVFPGIVGIIVLAMAATLAAQPGPPPPPSSNVLVLTPGQVYRDPTLPPGTLIRTQGWEAGPRVGPADQAGMAVIELTRTATLPAGSHLLGVVVRPVAGTFLYNLFDETGIDNVTFERVILLGDPTAGTRRGIANGSHLTVQQSYLSGFFDHNGDSQAIALWDTDGPAAIVDNYIAAWSENILVGGADPSVKNRIPSDIVISGNLVEKPLAWRSIKGRGVKNLFELKNARRVQVVGNTFQNNWGDGQNGIAILFTVRNQDGQCPWCTIQDVVFRSNVVQHAAGGFNVLGSDDSGPSVAAARIEIDSNVTHDISWTWSGDGRWLQLLTGLAGPVVGLKITTNRDDSPNATLNSFMTMSNGPTPGVTVTGNDVSTGLYQFVGDGVVGPPTLPVWLPGVVMTGNTFHGPSALCELPVPAGNTCVP
jgi:hypothetical protein